MDALSTLRREHGLGLIEDCAHAIETEYHGRHAGTFGDFGCFSFYVTKNVVTGEGGMVLASREEDAARIKILALHGMSKDAWKRFSDEGYKHYYVTECGYKYNMTDLQAALGIHQLARVERNWRAARGRVAPLPGGVRRICRLGFPRRARARHAARLPPLHDPGRRGALRRGARRLSRRP